MDYQIKHTQPDTVKTQCLVIGIHENKKLTDTAIIVDKVSKGYISKLLKQGDFEAKPGQTLMLYNIPNISAQRILLVGLGKKSDLSIAVLSTIYGATAKVLKSCKVREAVSYLSDIKIGKFTEQWHVRQAVIAIENQLYRFDALKSQKKITKPTLTKFIFAYTSRQSLAKAGTGAKQGQAIANGMHEAKTLGNLPGNVCTPSYLAKQAKALQQKSKIKTTVLNEAEMKKLKMGALLAVGQGSNEPAKLILMEYKGSQTKNQAPFVLVGKGITFDTGGISLKPPAMMDEMKFDMCGAASVMGVMQACVELALPINVIGVIAAAENMPGSKAIKPGDIVTTMSGQTVEILNTDAEGRLVLCDALSYVEKYKPAAVIDIATLTGACIVALGRLPSGLMGNNANLIEQLKKAGEQSGDRVWELPLWDEYRQLLKSNFADLANMGNRDGGTITAASYLSHFTEKYPWAHLDIAGTAWKSGKEKGATGRPVQLLMQYLMQKAKVA